MIANEAVTVHVPQGKPRDVMVIPKDAIVNRNEGTVVFVFDGGTVRPAAVTIGDSFDDMFEVLSGLRAGQQVVVTGNEGLRPGQPVRVEGKSSAAPAGARSPGAMGPGGNPAVGALIRSLSDDERQKFLAMSPEEKSAFIRERLAKREGSPGSGS
jgi:membrane fusion protein (multidrug efflux system)